MKVYTKRVCNSAATSFDITLHVCIVCDLIIYIYTMDHLRASHWCKKELNIFSSETVGLNYKIAKMMLS